MELGNISQPVYGPGPEAPGSSTPGLVGMVHGFLRLVQPNALPVGGCAVRGLAVCLGGVGNEVERLLRAAGSRLSLSPLALGIIHPLFKCRGTGLGGVSGAGNGVGSLRTASCVLSQLWGSLR